MFDSKRRFEDQVRLVESRKEAERQALVDQVRRIERICDSRLEAQRELIALLLDHLGLQVVNEPATRKLVPRPKKRVRPDGTKVG